MRLTFVVQRYWPAVGGMESFARVLVRGLGERHRVRVLCRTTDMQHMNVLSGALLPMPAFDRFHDGPVDVEQLRISPSHRLLTLPLLLQLLPGIGPVRGIGWWRPVAFPVGRLHAAALAPQLEPACRDADVVHMLGSGLLAHAVARACRVTRTPFVITPSAHRAQWGQDHLSRAAYRSASRVLALLQPDVELYASFGVAHERILVCGAACPAIELGDGPALRRRRGIEGPLVLYLGRRAAYKGVDVLLDAAGVIAACRPDVTFAFVGPGPALPERRPANVLDVGPVSDAERASWLRAATLLALPSSNETYGLCLLEAWSTGTPVVTSDIPVLRFLVERGGGGVWCRAEASALGRAILDLLDDPERLRLLGQEGHEFWRRHASVDSFVAWHERLYRAIASDRTADPV
jgi:starch synthase